MRIERGKSQLLITDIQEKLAPAVTGHEDVIAAAIRLTRAARRLGIPVTASEQYPQGLGPTVAPLKEAFGDDASVFSKTHFSCLRERPLRLRLEDLRAQGRIQVIVAGMEAHICALQTALDLAAEGFQAFIVSDAVSSRAAASVDAALTRLRHAGCVTITSEMAIFEWLDEAGTPEFKDLHKLVK